MPVLVAAAPLEAAGGILLLVGTLALGRFALATAALDTGSAFGGMSYLWSDGESGGRVARPLEVSGVR